MQIDPFSTEIFTSQSACSYYCPSWSPHPQLITFQLLSCSTIMFSLWDSLSQTSHMLPGLFYCIPFHPSPLFSVSEFCLPVPPLGHILVKSSLSSDLKNPIWSSLCCLNPLPMAHSFLSHAKFISPHHSLFFPHCVICSIQYLHHIFLMPFWFDTVLLTLPWSTYKEHMPRPNSPRDWHFKGNPSSPCLWPIVSQIDRFSLSPIGGPIGGVQKRGGGLTPKSEVRLGVWKVPTVCPLWEEKGVMVLEGGQDSS